MTPEQIAFLLRFITLLYADMVTLVQREIAKLSPKTNKDVVWYIKTPAVGLTDAPIATLSVDSYFAGVRISCEEGGGPTSDNLVVTADCKAYDPATDTYGLWTPMFSVNPIVEQGEEDGGFTAEYAIPVVNREGKLRIGFSSTGGAQGVTVQLIAQNRTPLTPHRPIKAITGTPIGGGGGT